MKRLIDFIDPYLVKGGIATGYVGDAWARILAGRVETICMDNEEFYHFVRFFINQLPHNFRGTEFMGVKIERFNIN